MTTTILQKCFVQAALVLISCSAALACHGTLLAPDARKPLNILNKCNNAPQTHAVAQWAQYLKKVSGISGDEKRIILQEHNRLRQIVATGRYPGQPSAENMREIVWDDELAVRAQQWADNCQFRHDPFRTINRFTMGQNLAIIWSTAPLDADDGDFPSRIQSWFNEVQKYSFGDAWSPKTGHYSQLVWGETSLVGCGYAEYKDATKYNKLYVCNYGPGGNVIGFNPYEVGKPACGTYGMRPSSRYQGLCSAPNSPSSGITTNTIETYEYKQSNAYNNKQTAYSTQFPQPASHSSPQQASSFPNPSKHPSVPAAPAAYGSGQTHTTEASQYKYKNKLEAYRPSQAEFQTSVLKHTILRSSERTRENHQLQQQQQQQQQQTSEQQQTDIYVVAEEPAESSTPKAAKRGWSLLTWRG